ncbi:MAG TPA: helix-turn-helix transcriptional regulator [Thermoanaerobaculia bacterium]|nr:helix-turn-helix transcriptional regulator [Thermoanaerobaculia bacterium]
MPVEEDAEEQKLLAHFLRGFRGLSQKQMARASGVSKSTISSIETGTHAPRKKSLARLASGVGIPYPWLAPILHFLARLRAGFNPWPAPWVPGEEPAREIAYAVETAVHLEEPRLQELAVGPAGPAAAEDELWLRLERCTPGERRVLVLGARAFRTQTLCQRLCAESKKATAGAAPLAVELADLALRLASLVPADEATRSGLEAQASAYLGNALRVANKCKDAERALGRARQLLQAAPPGAPRFLTESRLLDFEASLCREQRRFDKALALLDEALAKGGAGEAGRILLKKAFTLEQMEAYERAIAVLRQAATRADARKDPRTLFGIHFNLAVNYCHLSQHRQAEELLPEIHKLAARLGNELDFLRLRWLEGRIAGGLGRREEAAQILTGVRDEFDRLDLPYDTALASLDLAALRLEQGRTEEVKALARRMVETFLDQGVHREAQRALALFRDAAEREAATVALVRKLLRYLNRAQHDPRLRFAG